MRRDKRRASSRRWEKRRRQNALLKKLYILLFFFSMSVAKNGRKTNFPTALRFIAFFNDRAKRRGRLNVARDKSRYCWRCGVASALCGSSGDNGDSQESASYCGASVVESSSKVVGTLFAGGGEDFDGSRSASSFSCFSSGWAKISATKRSAIRKATPRTINIV